MTRVVGHWGCNDVIELFFFGDSEYNDVIELYVLDFHLMITTYSLCFLDDLGSLPFVTHIPYALFDCAIQCSATAPQNEKSFRLLQFSTLHMSLTDANFINNS